MNDTQDIEIVSLLEKDEVIVYEMQKTTYIESLENMWKRLSSLPHKTKDEHDNTSLVNFYSDVYVYNKSEKTKLLALRKKYAMEWVRMNLSDSRTITTTPDYRVGVERKIKIINNKNFKLFNNQADMWKYKIYSDEHFCYQLGRKLINNDIVIDKDMDEHFYIQECRTHIPTIMFYFSDNCKYAFLCGIIHELFEKDNGFNFIAFDNGRMTLTLSNKELTLQMLYLLNSLNKNSKVKFDKEKNAYQLTFLLDNQFADHMENYILQGLIQTEVFCFKREEFFYVDKNISISSIENIHKLDYGYFVYTTDSSINISGLNL